MTLSTEEQKEAAWQVWRSQMLAVYDGHDDFTDGSKIMWLAGYEAKEINAFDDKIKEMEG